MTLLTKEQILAASDVKTEEVDVPEWGGTVRVAVMSGTARDQYESSLVNAEGKFIAMENLRARFVSACLVDADNKLLFSSDDILALGKKSADALDRCFNVASRLNKTGINGLESAAKN